MDHFDQFLNEVIHLARFGSEGKTREVKALARKMASQLKESYPEFSGSLASISGGRGSLRSAKRPMPVDGDSRMALARVSNPSLAEKPVVSKELEKHLDQLIEEHRDPSNLRMAGLAPSKAALMIGPPGVGKTMASHWIARQLDRPLIVLDLASSVSSYLGKTGQNVRQVFDFAKEFECVLLLDEVDAIAKKRSDETDLGELKRLVNVLLQELDEWPEGSLVLAATNHPDLLDPAIWRRFETILEFDMPSKKQRSELLSSMPEWIDKPLSAILTEASQGMSHSDIVSRVTVGRRIAVLRGVPVSEGILESFTEHLKNLPHAVRHKISTQLVAEGISQRQAADLTGTSRNTIRKRTTEKG